MPIPANIEGLDDITFDGNETDDWTVDVVRIEDDEILGSYDNDGGSYTPGAEDEGEIYLVFNENSGFVWTEYDKLTLSIDGDDIDIPLPASGGISDEDVLYVDSNGLLFTDEALTTPAVDWVDIIPEDTVTPSDAIGLATESISDEVTISDEITLVVQEILDEVGISDEISFVVVELNDTVNIEDNYVDHGSSGFTKQVRGGTSTSWTEREGGVS